VAEKESWLEGKLKELEKREWALSSHEEALKNEQESFERFEKEKRKKALEEAAYFVRQVRREIDELIASAKKQAKDKAVLETVRRQTTARLQELEKEGERLKEKVMLSSELPKVGSQVYVSVLSAKGTLVSLSNSEAVVEIEGKTYRLKPNNLQSISSSEEKPGAAHRAEYDKRLSSELDLRGLSGDEAVEQVDRFIDKAILLGFPFVRIVHGKGTGILRKRVSEFLKTHTAVEEARLGKLGEGGDGVTIVKLKS
jgi:DNA mismatch repair protein MutS2